MARPAPAPYAATTVQPRAAGVADGGPRLRHFQKKGSVKEELKRSGSRVQVELKSTQRRTSNGQRPEARRAGRRRQAEGGLAKSAGQAPGRGCRGDAEREATGIAL